MKNQPLIQEVISQISQRFTPKIPDIKKVRCAHSFPPRAQTTNIVLDAGDRYAPRERVH